MQEVLDEANAGTFRELGAFARARLTQAPLQRGGKQ